MINPVGGDSILFKSFELLLITLRWLIIRLIRDVGIFEVFPNQEYYENT